MKRDWDLIRRILLKIEQLPTEDSTFTSSDLEGFANDSVAFQLRLLLEAQLIEGGCRSAVGPPFCHASRLTWTGCEFLDAIRRDSIWNNVKAKAGTNSIDLSFEVIKDLAKTLIATVLQVSV